MNINDLRLWKLNKPMKEATGEELDLWLTFTESRINKMARENPSGYLIQLTHWQKILAFQVMFSYDQETREMIVITASVEDNKPTFTGFIGHYNGEEVIVDRVTTDLPPRDYRMIKKEIRKSYKK